MFRGRIYYNYCMRFADGQGQNDVFEYVSSSGSSGSGNDLFRGLGINANDLVNGMCIMRSMI